MRNTQITEEADEQTYEEEVLEEESYEEEDEEEEEENEREASWLDELQQAQSGHYPSWQQNKSTNQSL